MTTDGSISIASDELRVKVNPRVGGTIIAITHLGLGLSVLGKVPWDAIDTPIAGMAARDETHWLTRYTGGWPLLFPNGGDACTDDGVFHGFHGEASIAPWTVSVSKSTIQLTRRFFTVPVTMQRELTVEKDLLIVRERLRMTGRRPIDVMWGHHATFGSDLLEGPVEITSGARKVTADDSYDPPANPLLPGVTNAWPMAAGKAGAVDLGRPGDNVAAMAYLHDFEAAWVAVRRLDDAVAVALSWTPERFPCAWLWYELGAITAPPWHGRGRLIGLEPNTTRSAMGLADARARASRLLRLHPDEELSAELRLHVFRPSGPVTALDGDGRAIAA
ncbi:DUF4432 family protein [Mesorhizobium sp. AR07]|uniref:DUF4432 family protein n=1 Tax=Mesorhizobium sp. AR07 TaxID=2865838 RepID=UPI002160F793|nr:DUF4432 family protein [Mesorhizobium sp. AR07]UVK43865.1 DUF4432 family protein [Mesorhizobium sp. AR07]